MKSGKACVIAITAARFASAVDGEVAAVRLEVST
jgi:hypothetical protein